jgi:hypothetical protein
MTEMKDPINKELTWIPMGWKGAIRLYKGPYQVGYVSGNGALTMWSAHATSWTNSLLSVHIGSFTSEEKAKEAVMLRVMEQELARGD